MRREHATNDQTGLRSRPLSDAGRFDPVAEKSGTLPAHWYTAPEIYRLEHEAIFYRMRTQDHGWHRPFEKPVEPEPCQHSRGNGRNQGMAPPRWSS